MIYIKLDNRDISLPWDITPFQTTIPPFPPKTLLKSQPKLRLEAKHDALSCIDNLVTQNNLSQIIYVDSSVHQSTGAAGSAAVVTQSDGSHKEIGARINNWASTLQAELFAILLALKCVHVSKVDTLIVTDSLSSINALNSEARHRYGKIVDSGVRVHMLWIPSHIGLQMHDRTDKLAKLYAFKEGVDYNLGLSVSSLRTIIRKELEMNLIDLRLREIDTSQSIYHHSIMQEEPHVYGASNKISRLLDVTTARLRLGYKYLWQVKSPPPDVDQTKCKLCQMDYCHTLHHYVLECDQINEFRNNSLRNVQEMAKYFIHSGILQTILEKYPDFASCK
nr:uncharacterized protein LOC128685005 [Cherax quadricarinatus]